MRAEMVPETAGVRAAPRPPLVDWRATAATAGVGAGTMLVLVGTLLPWVTATGELRPVNALAGDGAYLITAAVGVAAMWVAFLRSGGSPVLRVLIGLSGVLIAYWAAFDTWQLTRLASGGVAAGLSLLGPGGPVVIAGGVVVAASAVASPRPAAGARRVEPLRVLLAAALLTTASIHLQLMPDHFAESWILGLGFIVAAMAQLALGAVILVDGSRLAYLGMVGLSVVLIAIYAYAVLHGLPIGGRDMEGLKVGTGEAVDLSGALSKGAELVSIVLALVLLVRRR
jgi:hypothetical protein